MHVSICVAVEPLVYDPLWKEVFLLEVTQADVFKDESLTHIKTQFMVDLLTFLCRFKIYLHTIFTHPISLRSTEYYQIQCLYVLTHSWDRF